MRFHDTATFLLPKEKESSPKEKGSSAKNERNIRVMTNSHESQSEKQLASRGRETAAKKPHDKKGPRPAPLT